MARSASLNKLVSSAIVKLSLTTTLKNSRLCLMKLSNNFLSMASVFTSEESKMCMWVSSSDADVASATISHHLISGFPLRPKSKTTKGDGSLTFTTSNCGTSQISEKMPGV